MFAILFEVLLKEIQEEIHHFAGWEGGGVIGAKIMNKHFVNKLAFPIYGNTQAGGKHAAHERQESVVKSLPPDERDLWKDCCQWPLKKVEYSKACCQNNCSATLTASKYRTKSRTIQHCSPKDSLVRCPCVCALGVVGWRGLQICQGSSSMEDRAVRRIGL